MEQRTARAGIAREQTAHVGITATATVIPAAERLIVSLAAARAQTVHVGITATAMDGNAPARWIAKPITVKVATAIVVFPVTVNQTGHALAPPTASRIIVKGQTAPVEATATK